MKRILTILCTMITAIGSASAQNPMAEDMSRWADGWKHAFSKEGVREWKPEFTLRYYDGLVTAGPMLTGGIRIDEKRSFSIFMSQGDRYADYAPGDIYSIGTGICFRRYWHLGKRKTFAIYSDLYAGAGWIQNKREISSEYTNRRATRSDQRKCGRYDIHRRMAARYQSKMLQESSSVHRPYPCRRMPGSAPGNRILTRRQDCL